MSIKQSKKNDEILSLVAAKATLSVQGVAELVPAPIKFNLHSKEIVKGLLINIDKNNIRFDIFLNVYMGAKIPSVAFAVQEAVKKSIESVSDFKIEKININVQGISVKPNEKN